MFYSIYIDVLGSGWKEFSEEKLLEYRSNHSTPSNPLLGIKTFLTKKIIREHRFIFFTDDFYHNQGFHIADIVNDPELPNIRDSKRYIRSVTNEEGTYLDDHIHFYPQFFNRSVRLEYKNIKRLIEKYIREDIPVDRVESYLVQIIIDVSNSFKKYEQNGINDDFPIIKSFLKGIISLIDTSYRIYFKSGFTLSILDKTVHDFLSLAERHIDSEPNGFMMSHLVKTRHLEALFEYEFDGYNWVNQSQVNHRNFFKLFGEDYLEDVANLKIDCLRKGKPYLILAAIQESGYFNGMDFQKIEKYAFFCHTNGKKFRATNIYASKSKNKDKYKMILTDIKQILQK